MPGSQCGKGKTGVCKRYRYDRYLVCGQGALLQSHFRSIGKVDTPVGTTLFLERGCRHAGIILASLMTAITDTFGEGMTTTCGRFAPAATVIGERENTSRQENQEGNQQGGYVVELFHSAAKVADFVEIGSNEFKNNAVNVLIIAFFRIFAPKFHLKDENKGSSRCP